MNTLSIEPTQIDLVSDSNQLDDPSPNSYLSTELKQALDTLRSKSPRPDSESSSQQHEEEEDFSLKIHARACLDGLFRVWLCSDPHSNAFIEKELAVIDPQAAQEWNQLVETHLQDKKEIQVNNSMDNQNSHMQDDNSMRDKTELHTKETNSMNQDEPTSTKIAPTHQDSMHPECLTSSLTDDDDDVIQDSIHNLHLEPIPQDNVVIDIPAEIPVYKKKDSGLELNEPTTSIPPFYFPKNNPGLISMSIEKKNQLNKMIKETLLPIFNTKKEPRQEMTADSTSASSDVENQPPATSIPTSSVPPLCLDEKDFLNVTKALDLPLYLNRALFYKCKSKRYQPEHEKATLDSNLPSTPLYVNFAEFFYVWEKLSEKAVDEASLVFHILATGNKHYLTPCDFEVVINDVVENHPGLEFLSSMPLFQSKYVDTVVTRIFFLKPNCFNEKMTLAEFRKNPFLDILRYLEDEPDINKSRDLFSYKHFYVIYCKFWELDQDHDMFIEEDVFYERNSISSKVVKRIFDGAGRPLSAYPLSSEQYRKARLEKEPSLRRMSYRDFIYFILANEHKQLPSSIEYWFRILDTDGDGLLSLWELKYFWEEQFDRMLSRDMSDPWKFEDFVCSLQVFLFEIHVRIDLVKPQDARYFTLADLKKSPSAANFFDMIFDIHKYECTMRRIDPIFREMDDVYVQNKQGDRVKLEGWDKFAERAYEELALEESRESGSHYRSFDVEYDIQEWDSEMMLYDPLDKDDFDNSLPEEADSDMDEDAL